MKLRKSISVCLLAVYTIVVAHNFIPHHHHSDYNQNIHHCEFEKQDKPACDHDHHNEHSEYIAENCCVNYQHNHHSHIFCSFEERVVLTKGISLSNLFLPSIDIDYFELEINNHSLTDAYLPIFIHDPYCRDVQLRGPPNFS